MNTDYYLERLDKITGILFDKDGFWNTFATSANNGGVEFFKAGRALFYNETMGNAQKLRQMELDFGIIPAPKYNEEQTDYCMCGGNPYFMTVPTTSRDLEMVGIMMESLAYESQKTVKIAAYDEMLSGKVSRDNASEAMLDIIYNSLFYDIPVAYDVVNTMVTDTYMFKNKREYASLFTKYASRIQKEIDKYISAYNENND